jgi:hypothetical protein
VSHSPPAVFFFFSKRGAFFNQQSLYVDSVVVKAMSRHTQIFETERSDEPVATGADALAKAGFAYQPQNNLWKKGNGILVAPGSPRSGRLRVASSLSRGLKFALLPGVYLGEFDLEGSFMLIPKRKLRRVVASVSEAIEGSGGVAD